MEELKKKLSLSDITLGTMRFFDKGLSKNEVVSLIEKSWEIGINTHHSSFEYNSYQLYTSALSKSNVKNKVKHIVKLSSPSFDDVFFDANSIEKNIDTQLRILDVDCIDVLQWLVRSKPINDVDRLHVLENQQQQIKETFTSLKQKGKIKAVFSFPYSVTFAEKVIKLPQNRWSNFLSK